MKQSKETQEKEENPPEYSSKIYTLQFLDSDKIKWDGPNIKDGIHHKLQSVDLNQDLQGSSAFIYKIKGNPFLGDDELGMYVIMDLLYYMYNNGFVIFASGKLKSASLEKDTIYFIEHSAKGKLLGMQYNGTVLKVVNHLSVDFYRPIKKEYNRIIEFKVKEDDISNILNLLNDQGYTFYTSLAISGTEFDSDFWIFRKSSSSFANSLNFKFDKSPNANDTE